MLIIIKTLLKNNVILHVNHEETNVKFDIVIEKNVGETK